MHSWRAASGVRVSLTRQTRFGNATLAAASPDGYISSEPEFLWSASIMRRAALGLAFILILNAQAFGQSDPMPPERTAALMQVPDGFRVTLFAGEPDVVKPIAMALDDRGRLWVVESHSYPKWIRDGKPGKDRILIF